MEDNQTLLDLENDQSTSEPSTEPVTPPPEGAAAPEPATPTATPGPATMSKDDLQEILTKAIQASKGDTPAAQPAQQRTYTREEYDKAFNVAKIDAELAERFGGEEAATAFRDAVVKQAVTMAAYIAQQGLDGFRGEITPLQQYAQQSYETNLKDAFYKKHPDLKSYEPLLLSIRDDFVRKGTHFKSPDEAFDAVSKRAKEVIATLPGAAQNGGQPVKSTNKMSTVSSGGQGGGAAAKGTSGKKSAWQGVFD